MTFINRHIKIFVTLITVVVGVLCVYGLTAHAAINRQINYQGKLTNASNVAVADGGYNMRFKLYTTPSGGSPIWTETWCYSPDSGATCDGTGTNNRVNVINGLFSTMLGSTTALTGIDFNQTLYLGVEIGGTGSSFSGDGEMSPRKKFGTVPAAFVAETLQGLSSSQFFRSDAQNSTSSASTFLNVIQTGAGKIAELFGANSASVFTALSNGNVGIGTSTPYATFSVNGQIVAGYLTATTSTASTLPYASSTALTVSGTNGLKVGTLTGPLQAISGVVTASSSLATIYGGTEITSPTAGGVMVGTYAGGKWQQLATSSLGLITTNVAEGSNLYYLDSRVQSFVHASTTIPKTYTANTFTGAQTFNGAVSATAGLTTNSLTIGSVTGNLQAINGVVSASSTLSIAYGGTGLSTAPSYGNILVGQANGTYALTATSSLGLAFSSLLGTLGVSQGGTGSTSFGQGWIYSNGGTNALAASTSPTVAYVTATSTTATSTFSGGVNLAVTAGNVGIGTSTPSTLLDVNGPSTLRGNITLADGTVIRNTTPNSSLLGVSFWANGLIAANRGGGNASQIIAYANGLTGILANSGTSGGAAPFIGFADPTVGTVDSNLTRLGAAKLAIGNGTAGNASGTLIAQTIGVGTTSPYAALSVDGRGVFNQDVRANYYTATSTAVASTFPLLTTTNATTSTFAISSITSSLLKTNGNGSVIAAIPGTDYLTSANIFAYPFPSNATTTKLTLSGGLLSLASTTIGGGAQGTGLTISGGATTTGDAYVAGNQTVGGNFQVGPDSARLIVTNYLFPNSVSIGDPDANGYGNTIHTSDSSGIMQVYGASGIVLNGGGGGLSVTGGNGLMVYASSTIGDGTQAGGFTVNGGATTTGNLYVAGSTKLGSLTGNLQAVNGLVSASSTLSIAYGGTGLSTAPSYGNILVGQANGTYALTATSSLGLAFSSLLGTLGVSQGGTGSTSFGQGWIYSNGGTNALAASTSPTVAYVTATSTTATSTFSGGVNLAASAGNVGIGTINPTYKTDINGTLAVGNMIDTSAQAEIMRMRIGSSGGATGYLTFQRVSGTNASYGMGMFGTGFGIRQIGDAMDTINFNSLGTTNSNKIINIGSSNGQISASTTIYASMSGNTTALSLYNMNSSVGSNPRMAFGTVSQVAGNVGELAAITAVKYSSLTNTNVTGGLAFSTANDTLTGAVERMRLDNAGNLGIGTTTPWRALSVYGSSDLGTNASAGYFTATTTTASVFPYASTTAITVAGLASTTNVIVSGMATTSSLAITSITSSLLKTNTLGQVVAAVPNTDYSAFAYPFPAAATSTALSFSGGIQIPTTGTNPSIYNPTSGNGLILRGDTAGAQLRIVSNGGAWTDAQTTSYFQITNSTNNNVSFMGGTYGADAVMSRLQFNSSSTQMTDLAYGSTPVPTGLFEVINNTANKVGLKVRGATAQSADFMSVQDSAAASLFNIASTGNVGIGTSSPYAKLSVNGQTVAAYFTATTTTASTFPYASTTALSATSLCLSTDCRTVWPSSGGAVGWASSTANSQSIYSYGTGNVGIGTSSPTYKLSVKGIAASTNKAFMVTDSSDIERFFVTDNGNITVGQGQAAGGTATIYNGSNGAFTLSGNGSTGNVVINNANNVGGDIDIQSRSTSAIYIKGGGNVGIGTTSPLARLDVAGANNATVPLLQVSSVSSFATTTRFMVTNGGQVGIGTSSPATGYNLAINGNASAIYLDSGSGRSDTIATGNTSGTLLVTSNTDNNATTSAVSINARSYTGGAVTTRNLFGIQSDGVEKITVASTGFLGIGTTSPSYPLDIVKSNSSFDVARITNTGANFTATLLAQNDIGNQAIFGIAGSTRVAGTGGPNGIGYFGTVSNIGLGFVTNNIFRGIVDTNGNFGIGTTTPGARLSVEGTSVLGNNALAGYFIATTTTASVLPYASTTALTVSGTNGLKVGTLTGILQGINGTVSASSTLSVAYGGTGASSFGQGWLYSLGGSNTIGASTSPTVAYITATSTTGINTFGGKVRINTASSTGVLTLGTSNTNSTLDNSSASLVLENNSPGAAQTLLTFSFNGTPLGGVRGDYVGNFNWHATGSQGHQFYNSLDTSNIVAGIGGNGIIIKGTAGSTPTNNLDVLGNAIIGAGYATITAPTDGLLVQGQVGIGTSAPGAQLDVVGAIEGNVAGTTGFHIAGNDATSLSILNGFGFDLGNTNGFSVTSSQDGSFSVNLGPGGDDLQGGPISLVAGNGGADGGAGGGMGGDVVINGGTASGAGGANRGGNITLQGGQGFNGGSNGYLLLNPTRGSVGIGTSTPGRTLSVTGSSDLGNNALAGYFTATTTTASVFPYASTTALSATSLCLSTDCRTAWPTSGSGGGGVGWASTTANTQSVYFYGTSNVGVGSSTPFSKLSVSTSAQQSGALPLFTVASTTNSNLLTVLGNGNVGVGTNAPTSLFDMRVGGTSLTMDSVTTAFNLSSASNVYMGLRGGTSGNVKSYWGNENSAAYFGTGSNHTLIFRTNLTDRMTILNTGNIGIGTSTPGRTFSVTGSSDLGNNALAGYFTATTTTASVFPYASTTVVSATSLCLSTDCRSAWPSTSGGAVGWASTTADIQSVYSYGTNNVGIGSSTPWAKLSVTNIGTGPSFLVEDSTSPDTSPFVIDANGDVGIGTITPARKLDVVGTLRTSGTASLSDIDLGSGWAKWNQGSTGGIGLGSGHNIVWTNTTTNTNNTGDIGISRMSAGVLGIGNGTAGNASSTLITGRIGIGTTSPYAALSVVGQVVADYFTATSTTATSTLAGYLDVNGTNGTSTVASNLWVKGTLRTGTGSMYLNDTALVSSNGNLALTNNGNSYLKGGNFGIGTSTPTALLQIQSNTSSGVVFDIRSNTSPVSTLFSLGEDGVNNGDFAVKNSNSTKIKLNGNNISYVNNGANFGFGTTSPWGKLSIQTEDNASYPMFAVSSSTRPVFMISNDGQIRVGTTSPSRDCTDCTMVVAPSQVLSGSVTSNLRIDGPQYAKLSLKSNSAAADSRKVQIYQGSSGNFHIGALSDDEGGEGLIFDATRTGTTVNNLSFGGVTESHDGTIHANNGLQSEDHTFTAASANTFTSPIWTSTGIDLSAGSDFNILSFGDDPSGNWNSLPFNLRWYGSLGAFGVDDGGGNPQTLYSSCFYNGTACLSPSYGATGGIQLSNGFGGFATSTSLYFDTTNTRLGVGSSTPYSTLSVKAASAATNVFTVTDSSNRNLFNVDQGGSVYLNGAYGNGGAGTNSRYFTVGRSENTGGGNNGLALYIQAGGALVGGTNNNGGRLILASGTSTGTGSSYMEFRTVPQNTGSSGTADVAPVTQMYINSRGALCIGDSACAGTNSEQFGGLDIAYGGAPSTFTIGADANLETRTDYTAKRGSIGFAPYNTTARVNGLLLADAGANTTVLGWGGGTSLFSAPTQQDFYTAVATNTPTGTSRLTINSVGNIGINQTSPVNILDIQLPVNATAKTSAFDGLKISNTATSSTASIVKAGLEVVSTGTWNGTASNNIGVYVSSVTGGYDNLDAVFNGSNKVAIGTTTAGTANLVVYNSSSKGTVEIAGSTGGDFKICQGASCAANGYMSLTYANPKLGFTRSGTHFLWYDTSNGNIALNNTFGGSSKLQLKYGDVEGLALTSNLNIGIGSTTPWGKLSVNGTAAGTTPLFIVASSTAAFATSTAFLVDQNGLVGISTTTPWRNLSIRGNVAIDGLTSNFGAGSLCLTASKEVVYNAGSDACTSSIRSTKHGITSLSLSGLAAIHDLKPVSFIYNEGDGRVRYGFIAEDAAAVNDNFATHNEKGELTGIDDRALIATIVKAMQEQQIQIAALATSTPGVDMELLASTTARTISTDETFVGQIAQTVKNILQTATDWTMDRLTAHIVYSDRVEAQTVAVSKGLEINDVATGQVFCIQIRNGEWDKRPGVCTTEPVTAQNPAPASNPPVAQNQPGTGTTGQTGTPTTGGTTSTSTPSTSGDTTASSTPSTSGGVGSTGSSGSTATTTASTGGTTTTPDTSASTTPNTTPSTQPDTTTPPPAPTDSTGTTPTDTTTVNVSPVSTPDPVPAPAPTPAPEPTPTAPAPVSSAPSDAPTS